VSSDSDLTKGADENRNAGSRSATTERAPPCAGPEEAVGKLITSVSNFAAELERAKASQRTRDALQLKVQRGYVSGGVVFGYRNVPVLDEGGRRSHVVREIRDDETAIVRRIFEMVASGEFKAL